MKSAIFLAAAGVAVAQNLSGEPACASTCLISAISAAGCALDDQACACGPTQTAIATLAAPCLLDSCEASDLLSAQSVGSELCVQFSSTAARSSSGSGSATGTGAAGSPTITSGPTSTSGSATGTAGGKTTVTSSQQSTSETGSSASGEKPSGTDTNAPGSTTSNFAAVATPMAVGALAVLVGAVAAL